MYLARRARDILREEGLSNLIFRARQFLQSLSQSYQFYYRMLYNRWKYNALADPTKVVWIQATEINEMISISPIWDLVGSIEGGNWDIETSPLQKHMKFRAVKQHYMENKSWKETGIIDAISKRVEEHGSFDGCRNRQDVKHRYEGMDKMYQSLEQNGYDSSKHVLNPKWYNPITVEAIDHPMVCIGRNGEFLFAGGFHRVSMAHILDIEIPVWVLKRHKKWQLLREEIHITNNIVDLSPEAIDQLDHPDMQDVFSPELRQEAVSNI